MTETQLYQLTIRADKTINAEIADLLENLVPEPLSVSHFRDPNKNWITTAHYEIKPNNDAITKQISNSLNTSPESYELEISKVENIDWVSHVQKGLKPVRAGRFFIHGSHDSDKAENEPYSILIDAAQAFGTAHHGTTEGCLKAISELSETHKPKNILDLGAGSGILAIAASMVFKGATIIASDIDPVSVQVAKTNDDLNRPENSNNAKITHICGDALNDKTIEETAPFELLIANILAKPLISMAPDITNAVAPDGTLLLSGILDVQSDDVIEAYVAEGLTHLKTDLIGEWTTSLFHKNG
ncbi:MAG: ribosomal protein L11 methyltransferase [Methyloligella sp.]|nr:MAG: ribosomal protein L11 methyltransferase [Methyloligella sp.]